MSDFDILPEGPVIPKPALESRVRLLEGRVSVLERGRQEDRLWVEALVREAKEGLRATILTGIDQINVVLGETQKIQRSREAQEKALVSLCEETLAAVRGVFPPKE